MNIKVYSIALLSICTAITASENSASQYPFSDYDKKVFTNHSTSKVELIYSTPFIESISNDQMTIDRWELERLVYPALARIAFKKHDFLMGVSTDCSMSGFAITSAQQEELKRYYEKEDAYITKLNGVYKKVKMLMKEVSFTDSSHLDVSARTLMLTVQYAARKINYFPLEAAGITVSSGDDGLRVVFVHGEFAKLLTKYRAYEQALT